MPSLLQPGRIGKLGADWRKQSHLWCGSNEQHIYCRGSPLFRSRRPDTQVKGSGCQEHVLLSDKYTASSKGLSCHCVHSRSLPEGRANSCPTVTQDWDWGSIPGPITHKHVQCTTESPSLGFTLLAVKWGNCSTISWGLTGEPDIQM